MMCRQTVAGPLGFLILIATAGAAHASCAEDITRIEMAASSAAPDVQSRARQFADDAQTKARAKDFAGCEAATQQALQLLQLPVLPPLRLSTPLSGDQLPNTNQASRPGQSPAVASSVPPSAASAGSAASPKDKSAASGQSSASAPAAQQQTQEAKAAAAGAPQFMSTRELIGLSIRDRDNAGHYLGKISNVIFDRNTGRIQYVIIEHGGFLGWDRDRVVVPFSVIGLSGRWDYPTLQAPASKLENAPQIRQGDLDSLLADADWRRAVSDYFRIGLAESDQGGTAASPSGPSESVGGQTASASDATGPTSHPMASPGEGATGTSATSTVGAAAPAAGGEASAGPDPAKGQVIVQRVCAACHTFNQGGPTRVGPNLFGVAHRSIASVSGYNYSAALKGHSGDWDEASLETFLKDPRGFASGTYMTFPGIRSESDRRNVVAYLETLGAAAGAAK